MVVLDSLKPLFINGFSTALLTHFKSSSHVKWTLPNLCNMNIGCSTCPITVPLYHKFLTTQLKENPSSRTSTALC
jgi:hypothetical protein